MVYTTDTYILISLPLIILSRRLTWEIRVIDRITRFFLQLCWIFSPQFHAEPQEAKVSSKFRPAGGKHGELPGNSSCLILGSKIKDLNMIPLGANR